MPKPATRFPETKPCDNGNCNGTTRWRKYCGAYVCDTCENHLKLARCFCGWSASGGNGRQELIEMGETIDPEPDVGRYNPEDL